MADKIAVIGSGTMGAGIAQVCLQAGFAVALQDVNGAQLETARQQILRFLGRAAEKGQLSQAALDFARANLSVTTDLAEAAAGTAWVIEAIFESMDAKRDLYGRLNSLCPPQTRFASNTSGLSISEIGAAGGRPARTVGLHFFNPVPLMRLVEVVRGSETDRQVVDEAIALGEQLGKTVVVCGDSPNFIVNRINRPVYLEAQGLLAEGVPAATIDRAMVLGASFKMGPLQTSDLSGINIGLAVTENIFRETGDPRFRPSPLVRQMVRAGQTGKRAGKGFYLYPPGSDAPVPRQAERSLPTLTAPNRIAVAGEGHEARRWRGKLEQAGLPSVEIGDGAEVVLVTYEPGQDYASFFLETIRAAQNEAAIYAMMNPLGSVGEMGYRSGQPERVVGLQCPLPFVHDKFFELSLGLETSQEGAGLVAAMLARLDYKYVVTPELAAGIVRRVICAMVNEGAFALQEGLASPADIDQAMRLGMNYGLGPLEYGDRLGLDVVLATLDHLQAETGDPRYRPATLLRQYVRAGRLGQDTGRGFYD